MDVQGEGQRGEASALSAAGRCGGHRTECAVIETLLVLGASGDLAGRLPLPAIGQLLDGPEGPPALTVVGAGTKVWDEASWRERVTNAFASVKATGPKIENTVATTRYLTADVTNPDDLRRLLDACQGASCCCTRLPAGCRRPRPAYGRWTRLSSGTLPAGFIGS